MNIDELTLGDIRQLQALLPPLQTANHPSRHHSLVLGEKVIVRTVTHYYTGRLTSITETDIILDDAAWIADTGRWHNALKDGSLSQIEPFVDPVIVSRGSIVDVTKWRHDLPRNQK